MTDPSLRLPSRLSLSLTSTGAEEAGLDPRLVGLRPSATLAIQERSAQLAQSGVPVVRFGLGQSPFPVPLPVTDALRANAAQKEYLPVRGLPALRVAIARHLWNRHGVGRSSEDVLIAPGTKELMFLLQVVFRGRVVVPTPAWVSYVPQARILGRDVSLLATREEDRFQIDPDALDRLCREGGRAPRVLILNSPSNPTGVAHDRARLAAIADVARAHGMIVLSDEIYGELHFSTSQARHTSIATMYDEGTIVSTGLSKWCGAGGWRLGCFVFPPRLRWLLDAMAVVASETYSATSAPIQHAAVRAFQPDPRIEADLVASRRVLGALVRWACARLRDAGARVVEPDAAFYVFPSFEPLRAQLEARGIHDDVQLAERLLIDEGVAALPGSEFGADPRALHLRLALVDFDGARALTAAAASAGAIDETFLRAWCAPTVHGIERIARFATAS
ncbi:pyridoxal phosphate-dependent aminotransferase [Sandaracinus amylolyticus]|uniref:Aminotransferase n=1 Tax=Sandaracinus amylolyticus TaxID=927083 RepID=A0A0F6YGP5_9BACT|nr:aminotransferase class I/II-fold pyridoxal phosphate-dependent enzyme [Sandaracinus amylolyticus]AKF04928.1 Aspartate aminotransferase [Sandaracinus amylolyticus]